MKTIEIKSRLGDIILSSTKENIKDALMEAFNAGADLSGADLYGANISGADLYGADFSAANLSGADFSGANLTGADFSGANLARANLAGAKLSRAYLYGTDLSAADLTGAKMALKNGDFINIKHIRYMFGLYTYDCAAIITDEDEKYIKLGCFCRKVEDWEEDFWNNPDEFPNDGSEKSNLRIIAYETCKKWLKIKQA